MLDITTYSHRDWETALRGFNAACNGRRRRVLKALSPDLILRQFLEADRALAPPRYRPPNPGTLRNALRVAADANGSRDLTAKRPAS